MSPYDLFVIGGGSGGVRAARASAALGARVGLAEESALGGTCVNLGCIPKKLLWYGAEYRSHLDHARGYGWTFGEATFSWRALRAAKDREIARLRGIYRGLLEDAGVEVFDARATLHDAQSVEVAGKRWTSRNVLVATGGRPRRPAIPGAEHGMVSDDVFSLERLPDRVVVVGGGYIGVELAGVFHGLGAEVVLVHRGPMLLGGFDRDVRAHLGEAMGARGVDLRFEAEVVAIERLGDGSLRVVLAGGRELETEAVLFAIGRDPRTDGIGLERAGVKLEEDGQIAVDELSRTSARSVWAIGDVTNRPDLTPVAIHEGACLARTLFGDAPTAPSWEPLATAVFGHPPVGVVGLGEDEARERLGEVYCVVRRFRPLELALTDDAERTLVKMIVECASDRVVGLHMVGAGAPEIVQGFAAAMRAGITKAQLDATIGIHPTVAEELVTL
ncbi:MAG TPA: glutathione-disulfide reductase [Thermoanaerobaculia bacterium]|nr:glutathione-disulfide reductase [Thermoanaerobaculia bacterium]